MILSPDKNIDIVVESPGIDTRMRRKRKIATLKNVISTKFVYKSIAWNSTDKMTRWRIYGREWLNLIPIAHTNLMQKCKTHGLYRLRDD